MKKIFYVLFPLLTVVIVLEAGYYLYLTNPQLKSFLSQYLPSSITKEIKKTGRVEVESKLNNIKLTPVKEPLDEVLNQWKIWNEGIFTREEKRSAEIKRTIPQKIRLIFTYEAYERDKLSSKGKLISSAREELVGDTLFIHFGFDQDFLKDLDNEELESYLTQSFLTTLYRISHIDTGSNNREEKLKKILIDYYNSKKILFKII